MLAPTPYFSDRGCHVRIYEEAKALKARGHEVVIVTYHLGHDVGDIPVTRIANIPWYNKQSAGPSWHKPYLDILLLFKALAVAKSFRPDIIHAHLHEGAFLAAVAKRWLRAPIVFDCQGSLSGELLDHGFFREGGVLHALFSGLEKWVTKRSNHIVTSSTNTGELITKALPELAVPVTPLVDAVDTDRFEPLGKDLALLQQLGVPADKKLIVYLGAMTEYQGVDLLLESLVQLFNRRTDSHALLMGYPDEAYRAKAAALGLQENVSFTGRLDYAEAPRYLSLGDVAVSPKLSATEANGKLLNYIACGLPCVVFDNTVNRELLGEHGLYVLRQGADELATALERAIDDPQMLQDLSVRAREHAVRLHSWAARVETLEDIYGRLV